MIKRILVTLDPDEDTPIATEYAIGMAKEHDSALTGLAVVDTQHISSYVKGGGIGTIYYVEQLRKHLRKESREIAADLITQFKEFTEVEGVQHVESVQEGVPFQRIIEDMKYHDLVVTGREPHFFYNRSDQETDTLARMVKKGMAPVFVCSSVHKEIDGPILLAYDGSDPSARTIHWFAQQKPFGTDLPVYLCHVPKEDTEKKRDEGDLLLRLMGKYLKAHGFEDRHFRITNAGEPSKRLLDVADEIGASLVVAGAHSVSAVQRLAFGSTTYDLLTKSPIPLLLHH
jgi:nucleotide-binding universal stress UspA family protein